MVGNARVAVAVDLPCGCERLGVAKEFKRGARQKFVTRWDRAIISKRRERPADEVTLFVTYRTVCRVQRILDSNNSLGISFVAIAGTISLGQSAPLLNQFCARTLKRFNVVLRH